MELMSETKQERSGEGKCKYARQGRCGALME